MSDVIQGNKVGNIDQTGLFFSSQKPNAVFKRENKLAESLISGELDDHEEGLCDCTDSDPCYASLWLKGEVTSEQVILDRGQ